MTALLSTQLALGTNAVVTVTTCDRGSVNDLLAAWGHDLGPIDRPFGQEHWILAVDREPVALAVTASIVSPTIRDENDQTWPRMRTAELARICARPGSNWATRVILRLWREVLVDAWPHWQMGSPELLVAYATPGKAGHIYRTDGWIRVRQVRKANAGRSSTWSKPSTTDRLGNGRKTLWVYHREVTL